MLPDLDMVSVRDYLKNHFVFFFLSFIYIFIIIIISDGTNSKIEFYQNKKVYLKHIMFEEWYSAFVDVIISEWLLVFFFNIQVYPFYSLKFYHLFIF